MYTQKVEARKGSGVLQEVHLVVVTNDSDYPSQACVAHCSSDKDGLSERVRQSQLLKQHYQRTRSLETVEERVYLCHESLLFLLKGAHDSEKDLGLFRFPQAFIQRQC